MALILFEQPETYIVEGFGKTSEVLLDVLEGAGAKNVKLLDMSFNCAARADIKPSKIGDIKSKGFDVVQDVKLKTPTIGL